MHKFSDFLFDSNLQLSTVFEQILELENINPSLSLKDAIARTQKEWLRPAESERWHLHETKNEVQQERLENLFKKIGLIDTILPIHKKYDYVLFMGGDIHGMQERLNFLRGLFKNDLAIKEIVFLTAERPLDANHELVHLKGLQLKTEYDLLEHLYQKSELSSLTNVKITFVNTPNILKEGKMYRATTPDTIIEWLKNNPKPGSCLVISSQPLIRYQNAVAQTLLPHFVIESVGPESSTVITTPEYFDTLTRWLYQEAKLKKII